MHGRRCWSRTQVRHPQGVRMMCACRQVEWVRVLMLMLVLVLVLMLVSDFLRHVFIFTMLISFLVQDYPATYFETLIAHLQQPLPSIIINALSLLARLTAHSSSSGHTPPTLSPLLGPSFLALVPLRYLSTTPTSNTFMPLTQWSTSYSPLFVGKTHQVMSRLAHLAMDLAALHLLVYLCDSMTGF